jgi:hypothetical protein
LTSCVSRRQCYRVEGAPYEAEAEAVADRLGSSQSVKQFRTAA